MTNQQLRNSSQREICCYPEFMNWLNDKDKDFLLSVKSGEPNWALFAFPEAANLPAVQWKMHNISHMQTPKEGTIIW